VTIKVVLRALAGSDLRKVMALEKAIFSDPWPEAAMREHLHYPETGGVVAELDGQLIGYGCYRFEYGDVHLTNLAVKPSYRRKSVAKQLLAYILRLAGERYCESIFLEVRASNRAARAFYEKAGFGVIDRSPGYYNKPVEDAYIMARRLAYNPDDR